LSVLFFVMLFPRISIILFTAGLTTQTCLIRLQLAISRSCRAILNQIYPLS